MAPAREPAPPAAGTRTKGPADDGRGNASSAALAAGARALSAQAVALYVRAPAKAFLRTRVDYLAYARAVHDDARVPAAGGAEGGGSRLARAARRWLRGSAPAVLASAVRRHGWAVVPRQVLPPLDANVGVGAVLYSSYLDVLARLEVRAAAVAAAAPRGPVRPPARPPAPAHVFVAGLAAGALQSLVAAPLDALQARLDRRGDGAPAGARPPSLWAFGAHKLRHIGLRGVFAGWALSLAKDSLGSALFFTAFEYIKAQAYRRFVAWYYGRLPRARPDAAAAVRPHYAIEPLFLLVAGVAASFAQQLLLHPLTHFQVRHWDRLEDLDQKAVRYAAPAPAAAHPAHPPPRRWRMLRAYYRAYRQTWAAGCTAASGPAPSARCPAPASSSWS